MDQYTPEPAGGASYAAVDRSQFIKATFTYLTGAIAGFAVLSAALYFSGVGTAMLGFLAKSKFMWLGVLGAFMLVSWLATHLADNAASHEKQLMGLGIYVVAEAFIFTPLFALASMVPGAIPAAIFATALLCAALIYTALTAKTDFSFLGSFLKVGGFIAIGTIIAGVIFNFQLGVWFSGLMILFAAGSILYDTSLIARHYPADRPAGAALHLFASIALMLWYVIRLIISLAGDD